MPMPITHWNKFGLMVFLTELNSLEIECIIPLPNGRNKIVITGNNVKQCHSQGIVIIEFHFHT